jgi:hypothetical protein
LAQPSHVNTNRGIMARVVSGTFAKRIQTDRVLLEIVRLARKGFFREEFEETPESFRGSEGVALKDPVDLGPGAFIYRKHCEFPLTTRLRLRHYNTATLRLEALQADPADPNGPNLIPLVCKDLTGI